MAAEQDVIERRMAVKDAFCRHYRAERDRSEACIGDIIGILQERDTTDAQNVAAILDRIIKHYNR